MSSGDSLLQVAARTCVLVAVALAMLPLQTWAQRWVGARSVWRASRHPLGGGVILQNLADGIKLLGKASPRRQGSAVVAGTAAVVSIALPLLLLALIPWADPADDAGSALLNSSAGILFALGLVYAAAPASVAVAWEPWQWQGAISGMRVLAQFAGSSLAFALALVAVVVSASSLSVVDMVAAQQQTGTSGLLLGWPLWNVAVQPLGFCVYFGTLATLIPGRLDGGVSAPELSGQAAAIGGASLAYSLIGRRLLEIAALAFGVALYLGGSHAPGWEAPRSAAFSGGVFAAKTTVLVLLLTWLQTASRRTTALRAPRFVWKVLVPAAFANVIMTAIQVASR